MKEAPKGAFFVPAISLLLSLLFVFLPYVYRCTNLCICVKWRYFFSYYMLTVTPYTFTPL